MATNNVHLLNSMRTRVREARLSKIYPKLLKDSEIIADEKVWLYGHIAEVDSKGIRLYLGCDTCGQKTEVDRGQQFTCTSNYCKGKRRTFGPRMTLPFQFTDDTAMVKLSAFTEDAQKILGTTADHTYDMSYELTGSWITIIYLLRILNIQTEIPKLYRREKKDIEKAELLSFISNSMSPIRR